MADVPTISNNMTLSSCARLMHTQQATSRGDRLKEWREGVVVDERIGGKTLKYLNAAWSADSSKNTASKA